MRTVRSALLTPLLLLACGGGTYTPAPVIPPDVGPPLDPSRLPEGSGWHCLVATTDDLRMGDCLRSSEACEEAFVEKSRRLGPKGWQISRCQPRATAICYTFTLSAGTEVTWEDGEEPVGDAWGFECFDELAMCNGMRCREDHEAECSRCAEVP